MRRLWMAASVMSNPIFEGKTPLSPVNNMNQLFKLGRTLATPGAIDVLEDAGIPGSALLDRHVVGDWGDLTQGDKTANWTALAAGGRILSAYELHTGRKLWVITEAGRQATTILLPEEY